MEWRPADSDSLAIPQSSVTCVTRPQLNTASGKEDHGASLIIMVSVRIIYNILGIMHGCKVIEMITSQTGQILLESETILVMFPWTGRGRWRRQDGDGGGRLEMEEM